jgi:tetratricopeptide (TPR) repeat protein
MEIATLPDFPKTGISLLLLQKIRDHSLSLNSEWTTDDVCKNLILSWTENEKCSFVTLLEMHHQMTPHPLLNVTYSQVCHPTAHIFISHAWRYKFVDVVAALETYFETNSNNQTSDNTFLWFDLVVNDQWGAVILPQIWWKTVFMEAIESIGHTLMVTIPWRSPVTLTRAWCLWELYCTRASNSKLTLQLNHMEVSEFYREVRADSGVVYASLCEINVEKSQAYKLDDREMIFEAVRSLEGGFHSVNVEVKQLLRDWVRNSAMEMAGKLFTSDVPSDTLSTSSIDLEIEFSYEDIQNSHAAAIVLMEQGQLTQAHTIFVNIIQYHQRQIANADGLLDSIQLSLLVAKSNLALCCHREGLLTESQFLFDEVLQEFNLQGQTNTPEYLICLNGYGNLLYNFGKNLEALEIYDKVISCSEDLNGKFDPMTLDGLNNKAVVLKQLGKFSESIDIFVIALERKEIVFGLNHPSTLDTLNNLATCYKRIQNYSKSEEMYLKALRGYESTLGENDVTTLDAVNNIAILYKVMKRYVDSERFYQRAIRGYEAVLGKDHGSYLRTCYNFSHLLIELKKYSEAEKHLLHVKERYEQLYGPTSPHTQDVKLSIGLLYSKQLLKKMKALAIYDQLYEEYHQQTFSANTDPFAMLRFLKIYADFVLTAQSLLPMNLSKSKELYDECLAGYLSYYGLDAHLTQNFLSHYVLYLITSHSVDLAYEFAVRLHSEHRDIFDQVLQSSEGASCESIFYKLWNFIQNGQAISTLPKVCSALTALPTHIDGKHLPIHEHDLVQKEVLYNGGYNCDYCQEDGFGWGYCCEICHEDFHPLCAFGKRNMKQTE